MSTEKEYKVKIEKFYRPTNLEFLTRLDKIINLAGVARELPSDIPKQTLISRMNRHTDLTKTVEQKAFAEDIGEIFNEAWYIIGVALGKHPRLTHKKFKYFYTDEADRLKDKLDELERQTKD